MKAVYALFTGSWEDTPDIEVLAVALTRKYWYWDLGEGEGEEEGE